ncbi:hypothetical protein FFLO_02766 [Filobasidium floriforme]|uniref:JmjC domain-containing protein n=1 Tax=Filobasidium floriforme TaxID=5210 RepID=A0A8K0JND1_9TREE|nr:hypothetical protein FFLO_02766 [Filobasidium floriforme]
MDPEAYDRAIKLVQDYHDHVERYDVEHERIESDDMLGMMRVLMEARPRLIKGMDGLADGTDQPGSSSQRTSTAGFRFWGRQGLSSVLGESKVSIAITPNGLADSVQYDEETKKAYFAMPLTEKMTVNELFRKIDDQDDTDVCYLQSQNGNIWDRFKEEEEDDPPELSRFQEYVLRGPRVMQKLGKEPDAVNLWVGTSKSTTTLHKDPYDNLYQVLSGSKTFTLLSPIEGFLLNPTFYPTATYERTPDSSLRLVPDPIPPSSTLGGSRGVPWTTIDPTSLSSSDRASRALRPTTIVVREGGWSYLPANWWHHVQQAEGDEGICVAVNHWYDAPFRPDVYAMEQFILKALGRGDLAAADDDDDDSEGSEQGEGDDDEDTQSEQSCWSCNR